MDRFDWLDFIIFMGGGGVGGVVKREGRYFCDLVLKFVWFDYKIVDI